MKIPRQIPRFFAALAILGLSLGLGGCGGSSSSTTPPPAPPPASQSPFWAQWGASAQHTGAAAVAGQSVNTKAADIVYDPFVAAEQNEAFGELLGHYQATLTDGNDFYMESKSGTYPTCSPLHDWSNGTACGPNAWDQLIWNVSRYTWENGKAVLIWTFQSDWKPEPNATTATTGLFGWEPVFHPVLSNSYIYVPGAGGSVWKVDKDTGKSVSQITPLSSTTAVAANSFVSGPLTADASGNIYYNTLWLADPAVTDPWGTSDVLGAWLVKVTSADTPSIVSYATLVPGAPLGSGFDCPGTFYDSPSLPAFPWPPSPSAVAPTVACGSQRPGVNIAPAVAADGTVYTVSRAHFDPMVAYLVAVNPDLTPKWQASMQQVLTDGCGGLLPIASNNTTPSSCRSGTTAGVDPTTNAPGSGIVYDFASSTPTVLPDGRILFGALDRYNFSRGHMFEYDADGNFVNAYGFGWDSTPAVYVHDSTYSIIVKDNHYPSGAYCSNFASPVCTATPSGPFYITQLDADLNVEWQFQNTTIDNNHPGGYEWCVNAPAVDSNGVVYVNSEDGNVYTIAQGNSGVFTTAKQFMFLQQSIEAAYTPISVGADGKLYVQNAGHLFVVGN